MQVNSSSLKSFSNGTEKVCSIIRIIRNFIFYVIKHEKCKILQVMKYLD